MLFVIHNFSEHFQVRTKGKPSISETLGEGRWDVAGGAATPCVFQRREQFPANGASSRGCYRHFHAHQTCDCYPAEDSSHQPRPL